MVGFVRDRQVLSEGSSKFLSSRKLDVQSSPFIGKWPIALMQCIATMQYIKAELFSQAKEARDDGSIVEIVI